MSQDADHSDAAYPAAPRRSPLVIWLTLAGIAGLALLYVAVAPAPFQPVRRHPAVGSPLPTVNLTPLTVDGPPLELRDLRGKVVLLNFWGTWCPPCVEEFPHLERVAAKYAKDSGFRLISVSCEAGPDEADLTELREQTRAFLKQMESATPTYADPSGDTRRAIEIVSGEGFAYPTTLVLDRDGVIRGFWIGYSPQAIKEIERTLRELLEK